MRERSLPADEVIASLARTKEHDYSYDRFFSTMCSRPHPIAVRAHDMFLETNLGDPGLFPGTAELEEEAVRMLGELLGCPQAQGYISTGGTESNIQAIRAAKNRSGKREGNIIVPASAHFSFDKIGDLLSLEVRKAELDSRLRVDISSVEALIDEQTAALVGIAGTTEFGQVDPIEELADIASEWGVHLHVDAAFGGFVLPFLDNGFKWDFSLPAVSSITIDPHKMGLATIPAGGLLFRNQECMNALETETHYLTRAKQTSLTGTRSGAAAAATYAVMMHLGREGFREMVGYCMELTRHLVRGAREIGVEPLIEPVMNVVALQVPHPPRVRERLMDRDWHVSMTREPNRALRLILMTHMSHENIDLFLADLKEILADIN
ncbi:MAG TPA: tyrosine decarboxylase MfnA [Methanothrix sp.]|jgi:tyrosine decarboxylase/aspartate 1-decarboxylase|uniref:tyrosine decarboxylase MfnA n=1 Tax=Methanothrix sp. TaxID=90426 RepID=UPI002B56EC1F|nr:tyrosine decarboxylase MfnA [Methanothrix sp.]MDI9417855.1 tyrosine decarboxylase MfnA [Euryarchaeota archaeon]HON36220.1 tyrosine decarboxylase MfnA [Methanothrix sp.]HRU74940.1 tyrosine decarboxylase MfnA [Methanothrix sp.]